MTRIAFKMKIFPGKAVEYKRRHDILWPDLKDLLKDAGISDYSIFLDEETNSLFAYLRIEEASGLDTLPQQAIMQKWWSYMKDIMETHPDQSPIAVPLQEVFYLP